MQTEARNPLGQLLVMTPSQLQVFNCPRSFEKPVPRKGARVTVLRVMNWKSGEGGQGAQKMCRRLCALLTAVGSRSRNTMLRQRLRDPASGEAIPQVPLPN